MFTRNVTTPTDSSTMLRRFQPALARAGCPEPILRGGRRSRRGRRPGPGAAVADGAAMARRRPCRALELEEEELVPGAIPATGAGRAFPARLTGLEALLLANG